MEANLDPGRILETFSHHLPTEAAWIPAAGAALTVLVGVLLLVKGGRLAPAVIALVLAGAGALGGALLPAIPDLPAWSPVIIGALVGLVLGILLFRVWLTILVAACLAGAALSVYGSQTLGPPLREYLSRGYDSAAEQVTLLAPAGESPVTPSWRHESGELWWYVCQTVPSFRINVVAIALTAGIAGLVFALLLPKLARAFWAATTGTALFLVGAYPLLQRYWPAGATALDRSALLVAAFLWGGALIYNVADLGDRRPITKAPEPEPAPHS